MIWFRFVNKPGWLVHVDCFFKVAVKKGVLDVKLSKRLIASESHM